MSDYLPDHITEAHVFLDHDGVPTMTALWNGEPWLFVWKDKPPTWVSLMDMSFRTDMWDLMHSPVWQRKWLPQQQANVYHKLAFPDQTGARP